MMESTPTDPNPSECRHLGDGKCCAPKTIQIIGRCATCPLIYDSTLYCPDFAPKEKINNI